jgi:hypothetical protein
MPSSVSTFLDFSLPNTTTWFYFSFLLAIALFFKFSRLLSVRNLDVIMIFLLVPGLLIVQAARPHPVPVEKQPAVHIASLLARSAAANSSASLAMDVAHLADHCGSSLDAPYWLWVGYVWLLVGSVYFFCRCLLDLMLVQRPALGPNLQIGGLAWLAAALLICMLAVAYRQADRQINPAPPNGSNVVLMAPTGAHTQPVFAVNILWRAWPAWGVAALAFSCHIVIMLCLVFIGWKHFQDVAAGIAAATFYLLLPYTGFHVGQLHHALPMALFLGTIVVYRYPTLAGAILAIAAAATYLPFFTLPIWLSFYRGRGLGRFLAAFLIVLALFSINMILTLRGHDEWETSIHQALNYAAWQPWRVPETESFWTGTHSAYRVPVFVAFLAFVVGTMFWPTPKNLAHVIALTTAVFVSLQWWFADQGGAYVLWYLPLMLLLIFRPNLQDRTAPLIDVDTDWLTRSLRAMLRVFRRTDKSAQPLEAARSPHA